MYVVGLLCMWVLLLISDEIELRPYATVHVHGLQSPSLSGELYNEAQTADGTSHWFPLILAPNSSSTTRLAVYLMVHMCGSPPGQPARGEQRNIRKYT